MEQIKKFTTEFFTNLKCNLSWHDDILKIENTPRSFEDLLGKTPPYLLTFSSINTDSSSNKNFTNLEFVGKGSKMMNAILEYLRGAGKATLLKIDFNVDAQAEIKKRLALKNCKIESLKKSYKNNSFSRFSFAINFSSLNTSEKLLSEIYIHNKKIVQGDLSGYAIVDGNDLEIDSEKIKQDYEIAKLKSLEMSKAKQEEIAKVLKEKAESEIARIEKHYEKRLKEIGGDINEKLKKINEVELRLRSCDDKIKEELRKKLQRLKNGLIKVGDDAAALHIQREKEMTIKDVIHKYSLNVNHKLMNTTLIYYPIYSFKLFLKGTSSASRFVKISYDPLTKDFSGLDCETCGKKLEGVNLCDGGHVYCESCLEKCTECFGVFCAKCLTKRCNSCGKKLCKNCSKICMACGGSACNTHLRKDCVSGEDRCVLCLRACLRCHGMCEEKFFGEALDGSKVCAKCLGVERSQKVLKRVFGK